MHTAFFLAPLQALTPPIEGVLFTFVGYSVMACLLMLTHKIGKAVQMPRTSYYAGLFYIYIKVAIVAFLELGVFTAFCGLWIDACSLVSTMTKPMIVQWRSKAYVLTRQKSTYSESGV